MYLKKIFTLMLTLTCIISVNTSFANTPKETKTAPATAPTKAASTPPVKTSLSLDLNDPKNLLKWEGAKQVIQSKHYGSLKLSQADIKTDAQGEITGGVFTIDMKSLTVEDIKDSSKNTQLKNHLFSDDFFSIEKHPAAQFKITKVEKSKEKNAAYTHRVTGDLTIKGITHSLPIEAKIEKQKNGLVTILADIPVNRTKWDIRYNSGKFFTDLAANNIIKDEFLVKLNLTTK